MADEKHIFALVVGAGMGGCTLGAQFIRQGALSRDEFRIIDRGDDYGGVWQANKYPGAACDVPSHAYVVRFHLKADWSRDYAEQPEIQAYYADMAKHYKLRESTVFSTEVISAHWNEEICKWKVLVRHKKTGKETIWFANVVVNAGGQFSTPKYAEIPGMEKFKGTQWHSSQWNTDFDLTGKRVAIIGTGPSTAQLAPRIADKCKELILYQRSATYCLPRNDQPMPWWKKLIFKWVPFSLYFYHLWWYLSIEGRKKMWLTGTKENAQVRDYALAHLNNTVKDSAVRQKLTPTHAFGCKRVLVLDNWYPMFNRSNVQLITDKPVRITEDSIISKPPAMVPAKELQGQPVDAYTTPTIPGEEVNTKIDVLIWGTGFNMTGQGSHFEVYGRNGLHLGKHWEERPTAYYATQAGPDFPNFMMILGPNSANFWSNIPTLVQIQTRYNIRLMTQIKRESQQRPYALSVTKEAIEDYNQEINAMITPDLAVLSPNCNNYYTNNSGELTYWGPLRGWVYAWRLRKINWRDYNIILAKGKAPSKVTNVTVRPIMAQDVTDFYAPRQTSGKVEMVH